ncbi:MAG: glycosyltransferase family 39 protein [Chloroflexi bacterium]|nr:glycosyltransferase family 39 protein [Chloroflexota bacterium]
MRTSESPLNPYNKGEGFYVYGNFPMTATKYVAEWAEAWRTPCNEEPEPRPLCRNPLTSYDGVHLIGRILSALLDLTAVLFTFLIGRRLYSDRVGLLAAFLMATAVMPIQQSHFYTMDNWAAGLATMTIYAAVRASEQATRKRWWALFGILLGLTLASRVNVAPLAGVAGVAGLIWLAQGKARESKWWPTYKVRRGASPCNTSSWVA